MLEREKISKLLKKKFRFLKYGKYAYKYLGKKIFFIHIKNKGILRQYNSLYKINLNCNIKSLNKLKFFFNISEKSFDKDTYSDFFFKIKINSRKLLLNIYDKGKSIKNNRTSKLSNKKMFLKFLMFFLKKIAKENSLKKINYIFFKIKKKELKKKIKKKKMIRKRQKLMRSAPRLKKKILNKIIFISIVFNLFLLKNFIKFIPLYNKSHSKSTIKLKKKRRK